MTPRPKRYYRNMTPEKARRIRARYFDPNERITQRELAAEHGIRQNTVSRIVSGLVWERPA